MNTTIMDEDELLLNRLDEIETNLLYNEDKTLSTEDYKSMILQLLRVQQATSSLFSGNETSLKEYDPHAWRFLLTPYYISVCFQDCHPDPNAEPDRSVRAQIREKYLNQALVHMRVFDEKMLQFKIIPSPKVRIFREETEDSSSAAAKKDPFASRTEMIMRYKIEKERNEKLKKLREDIKQLKGREDLNEQDKEKLAALYKEYSVLSFHKALDECKHSYPALKQELEFVKMDQQRAKEPAEKLEQYRKENLEKQRIPSGQTFQSFKQLSRNDTTDQTVQKLASMGMQAINLEDRMNARQEIVDRMFRPFNPPTMSLEEYAEQEMRELQERTERQKTVDEERKRKEAQKKDPDEETEEELYEKRRWDDWKDDHVKGSGNLNR